MSALWLILEITSAAVAPSNPRLSYYLARNDTTKTLLGKNDTTSALPARRDTTFTYSGSE